MRRLVPLVAVAVTLVACTDTKPDDRDLLQGSDEALAAEGSARTTITVTVDGDVAGTGEGEIDFDTDAASQVMRIDTRPEESSTIEVQYLPT
jgi:hypothetical protein